MKQLLLVLSSLLALCAGPDRGFIETETGASARWEQEETPLLVLAHPSAQQWIAPLISAAEYLNARVGCKVVEVSHDLHPEAEAFLVGPGVVPAFGFDYAACEPKDQISCFPRTYVGADPVNGHIRGAPMFLPVAAWTPLARAHLWWIATHELGHTLGLAHDDQGPEEDPEKAWSLMQPRQSLDNDHMPPLTDADAARLRERYCRK